MLARAATIGDLYKVAQEERRGVAWPLAAFAVFSVGGMGVTLWLATGDAISLAAAAAVNFVFLIVGYTGLHEAIHENYHGRNRSARSLNFIFGELQAAMFLHSFALHRFVHLAHHSHTNDRTLDPDAYMAADSLAGAILRSPLLMFSYFFYAYRRKAGAPGSARFALRVALEMAPPLAAAGLLAANGHADVAVFGWIIPAILAAAFLGVILDWAPHHPHAGRERMDGTRMIIPQKTFLGWAFTWGYLFQNFHLIHHLFPRIPFYTYARVYWRSEEALLASGARISRLGGGATA